ncbi:hypothetical protein V3391_01805 [Luteimonas sp. SMYT11W]|uniref:Uncharacterized protein n=1 Tax=Luteimonas flava TaxID=3115822 RepID=A0ABU7WAF8_9GAMM
MSSKDTRSASNPDQPQQRDHVAVNDRKAARGDAYAHDDNPSAEGNDTSLTAGPSFERRVHADGHVEGVPPPVVTGDDSEDKAGAHDASDRTRDGREHTQD